MNKIEQERLARLAVRERIFEFEHPIIATLVIAEVMRRVDNQGITFGTHAQVINMRPSGGSDAHPRSLTALAILEKCGMDLEFPYGVEELGFEHDITQADGSAAAYDIVGRQNVNTGIPIAGS